MDILKTGAELAAWRAERREDIGLVPTMGNLHSGHMALVDTARAQCSCVVVSIFVNPLQFGPDEDFDSYPRTFEADCAALEEAGADAVFAPTVDDMYPRGGATATTVNVPVVTDILCGRRRPGHFEGVATVVTKLFNLVRPDRAYFGEKDYQQLVVLQRMASDLCTGVSVVGVPTARQADGLAQSSRNQYLDSRERQQAAALSAALAECVDRLKSGRRDFSALETQGCERLESAGLDPDYFEIRDADLDPPTPATRRFRVLAAAYIGRARLIDNMACELAR